MKTMRFLPELQLFLKNSGRIYTLRGFNMQEADVNVENVGLCRRTPLGLVEDYNTLQTYVSTSGFSTLEAWIVKLRLFVSVGKPVWLYQVDVKGGDVGDQR